MQCAQLRNEANPDYGHRPVAERLRRLPRDCVVRNEADWFAVAGCARRVCPGSTAGSRGGFTDLFSVDHSTFSGSFRKFSFLLGGSTDKAGCSAPEKCSRRRFVWRGGFCEVVGPVWDPGCSSLGTTGLEASESWCDSRPSSRSRLHRGWRGGAPACLRRASVTATDPGTGRIICCSDHTGQTGLARAQG
jgi:hypothetical protein